MTIIGLITIAGSTYLIIYSDAIFNKILGFLTVFERKKLKEKEIPRKSYDYILFGLVGLGVFFVLAHAFYYMRIFAGGDAKLLIALGTIIPIESSWHLNLLVGFVFVIALFFTGAVYSLVYSGIVAYQNREKFTRDFKKQFKENKTYFFISLGFAIVFLIGVFISGITGFIFVAVLVFILPYLYVYTKAVESSCMTKEVNVRDLTVGDWLVQKIKVKEKMIKANWEGLDEEQLVLIQKNYRKKVLVKYGIPFTPAFLFALLAIILVWYFGDFNLRFLF